MQRATGTGFIISKDGFILTNNHVVEEATKIEVFLYADDETSYSAKVIGRDALLLTGLCRSCAASASSGEVGAMLRTSAEDA